jgi:hypothetical protein
MANRGTTPAAWAPAEGEGLAGGGALMSANLLGGTRQLLTARTESRRHVAPRGAHGHQRDDALARKQGPRRAVGHACRPTRPSTWARRFAGARAADSAVPSRTIELQRTRPGTSTGQTPLPAAHGTDWGARGNHASCPPA